MYLLENRDERSRAYLFNCAQEARKEHYGDRVYIRGLIEISNYCKNNCLYCGIRSGNRAVERYRLKKSHILDCCSKAYEHGFRTFVLQAGEDCFFDDEYLCDIVNEIKVKYRECAITLSLGERSKESYKKLFDAGATRYLLRHETADKFHYQKLHPKSMSFANRIDCLYNLKEIGYQVGCGFMVGSPFQTVENLALDMMFISEFKPHMVGLGPFIPHKDTPFKDYSSGSVELTLFLLALVRLAVPKALIPATTALRTIDNSAYRSGMLAGANVVMMNFSPDDAKNKYLLYNNKICSKNKTSTEIDILQKDLRETGYKVVVDIGNYAI